MVSVNLLVKVSIRLQTDISDNFFRRPESAMSHVSRAPNKLRKMKSNTSLKSSPTDRSGALTPPPKSPKATTPSTAGRARKFSWALPAFRSPRSSQDKVFRTVEHEPLPNLVIPPGFQFPGAMDSETPDQTADIEKIRSDMIAAAYENQGLNRDGTEKTGKRQIPTRAFVPASDIEKTVTPVRKGKEVSPAKTIEKLIEAALCKSYSPSKPELVT